MTVRINKEAHAILVSLLKNAGREEVCALLSGPADSDGTCIAAAHPVPNASPEPAAGFQIDPALQARLQRSLRSRGLQLAGHFHSHPSGEPSPSARDRVMADGDGGQLWLIGAVRDGRTSIRAWQNTGQGLQPLPLEICSMQKGEGQWQGAA